MANGFSRTKRVLVTGGAGFLGSHLCDRLIAAGNEVLCVDNLYTGTRRNIAHLLDNPSFEFMRHDVTFPLYVEVDQIYISPARPRRSIISTTRSRRPRPPSMERSTCSASPSG